MQRRKRVALGYSTYLLMHIKITRNIMIIQKNTKLQKLLDCPYQTEMEDRIRPGDN